MKSISSLRNTYIDLHVPENAMRVNEDSGLAVVYLYINAAGRPAAIAFVGKQSKPVWSYYFSSVEKRDEAIAKLFQSVRSHHVQVAARQADRRAGHTLQPGDIVWNSWGYDQTKIEWFRVTRATKNYVWFKPMCGVETESAGTMSGLTVPGQESTKPAEKHWACGEHVSVKHGSASKWDGKPRHYSTYA